MDNKYLFTSLLYKIADTEEEPTYTWNLYGDNAPKRTPSKLKRKSAGGYGWEYNLN